MSGVITTSDLLTHGITVICEFGIRAYMHCVYMVLTHRHVTFLQCVCTMKATSHHD